MLFAVVGCRLWPAAQKDAAQDQGLHRCGMRDGVGQGKGATPAAAKNVHLAIDVQLVAERRHVVDQVLGRIVGQRRRCVIMAGTGRALAATALVEKHNAVSLRTEKPCGRAVAACTRPAMHNDDRLPGERAVFLPINPMLGKSRRGQMAGPNEGWARRLVVWRGRLGACIHGKYFCDKWEVGCECERALPSQAYAKIVRAVVRSFKLDAHPAFYRSLGKLQEPGADSASGPHRDLNRVKERLHECMAR